MSFKGSVVFAQGRCQLAESRHVRTRNEPFGEVLFGLCWDLIQTHLWQETQQACGFATSWHNGPGAPREATMQEDFSSVRTVQAFRKKTNLNFYMHTPISELKRMDVKDEAWKQGCEHWTRRAEIKKRCVCFFRLSSPSLPLGRSVSKSALFLTMYPLVLVPCSSLMPPWSPRVLSSSQYIYAAPSPWN